jgi:hypothetical protein
MVDWSKSMQQTFEYYVVDPGTWKDVSKVNDVKSCTISWNADSDTLGSATIDIDGSLEECYIRVYLVTIQNGVKERHPLGTFMVQTPSTSFDGKVQSVTMDAYTPLIELKEKCPPYGYSILKNTNIMDVAYRLTAENLRAPVVKTITTDTLYTDFVSEPDDTWITFLKDLLANAKYSFGLDELGRVLFTPNQDTAALQPLMTFDDSNSSILYPDISMDHDLYGLPNVVEVIYSNGTEHYQSRVVNDDENSPISTVNRGREIIYRDTNPRISGQPTKEQIDAYAKRLLRALSSIEYTITFKHGYCGVRLGDCIRLNYARAGINNIKAKIISQSIKCEPGCSVKEKAVFTTRLWG